jgi:hypothetical protein
MREIPPADPFPNDALGDVLGSAARAIHDRVRAPLAICAQSVLATATLAVQGHVDIVLPIGNGRAKPVSSDFVTVALSGDRKSESDYQAMWPIEKHEKKLREEYDSELPQYLNDKEAWEATRKKILATKKVTREEIKEKLNALGPPPLAPLQPILTCPEPTYEGLWKLFATGYPSLGLFSTEGGQFIGGHGMSEDNKLKTASGLSDVWDGKPMRRVRAGDGASILPGRRLSMHLMVQPEVADILFGDALLVGQGMLSRMLTTAPDSIAGSREWREEHPSTDHALKRYGARLLDILERPLPLVENKNNELAPVPLSLSMAARDRFIKFHDYVERSIRSGGVLEPVRGLANKLPEHAARMAAVLTCVGDIDSQAVGFEMMTAGIAIAEHYAAEAMRLFQAGQVAEELRLAKRALAWIQQQPDTMFSLPDLYQKGPYSIRDKATAMKVVGILDDHGYLVQVKGGAVIGGQQRKDVWRLASLNGGGQ